MIKRFIAPFSVLLLVLTTAIFPQTTFAAGVSASGGGSYTVGTSFTVNVVASGATFNTFVGDIVIAGPVSASIAKGSYSSDPSDTLGSGGKHFDGGITSATTSFTIARISLRGTAVGSGSVTIKNVSLINNGVVTATGGGSTSFTITRAPTPSGAVTVTSSTNPDQTQTYGVTTVQLAWTAPANGATGYSTVFDQSKDTVPGTTVTTTALSASYANLNLGTYYFHIRANNADGWGPTTTFQVNIGRALDGTLTTPTITSVTKLPTFVNDVTAGTLTGFQIAGTSTGLDGYTVTLQFSPAASIPAAQKLDSPVAADGSWQVVFDQPIPVGFYKVTAQATKDKTTTATSAPVSVELSVANGGTAKIITASDLPQPDLTVKIAGLTFTDKAHFRKYEWLLAAGSLLAAAVGALLFWFCQLMIKKRKKTGSNTKDKVEPKKEADLPPRKPRLL